MTVSHSYNVVRIVTDTISNGGWKFQRHAFRGKRRGKVQKINPSRPSNSGLTLQYSLLYYTQVHTTDILLLCCRVKGL